VPLAVSGNEAPGGQAAGRAGSSRPSGSRSAGSRPGKRRAGDGRPGDAAAGSAGDAAAGSADPGEAAREICLRLLATGPRTRAQLASALRRRRVPDDVAETVLGRFTEVRLIDDAAFAQAWVETRHHGRGLARRALSAELRQRGVAVDEVRAAVASLGPQEETATARRLVAKRVEATRGRPLPARVRHLVGMLARKGYPAGLAYQVVREALEQEREQADRVGVRAGVEWAEFDTWLAADPEPGWDPEPGPDA